MAPFSPLTFSAARSIIAQDEKGLLALVNLVFDRVEQWPDPAVWIWRLSREEALDYAQVLWLEKNEGLSMPLYGLPFTIKDNIDWAGRPTTTGCPAFSYIPEQSATVVEKLMAAGAWPVGKTNLDQFATGLVGVRSPYGAPRLVYDERYISGGSSSGSAVAVAAGLVAFSLGTDTAGSGRVPAAFNNLFGLKPTRGRLSTAGVVPACRSLDCVSIFTQDLSDSQEVLHIAEGLDERDAGSRSCPSKFPAFASPYRLGIPSQLEFFGDAEASLLFQQARLRLEQMGAKLVEIDFSLFRETAELLYSGPWVAERLAAIEPFYRQQADAMDPTVRKIIQGAEKLTAVDAFRGMYRLQELQRKIEPLWQEIDGLFLPTTGTTYTVEQIQADPLALNNNLSYYTNFVNLLDLCCLAVPAGFRPNGLPFGVTFMAQAWADEALATIAEKFRQTI